MVLAVLSIIVAIEYFFGGVTTGEGPRAPARIVEAKLLPPFTLSAEAAAGAETVARPLFVPTRRPSPPAASAAAQTMRRGQFVLTGISIAQDAAFAFLRESSSGKTHSVRKGASVNGLTVDKVEPRRVVLRMGEELEELSLQIQAPARVAAAPAPAPTDRNAQPATGTTTATTSSRFPRPPGANPAPPPGLPSAAPHSTAPGAPAATPAAPAVTSERRRPWMMTPK